MEALTQGALAGLAVGATYALIAMGFSLFYSSSNVLNLAHGSVVMLVGLLVAAIVGRDGSPWLALGVSVVLGVALSLVVYAIFIRPLSRRSPMVLISVTLGVLFLGGGIAQAVWGSNSRAFAPLSDAELQVPGGIISGQQSLTLGIVVLVTALLAILLRGTLIGRALRAVADDVDGAASVGIDARRMMLTSVAISGALAGLAAALIVPQTGVDPTSGGRFTLVAAVAAIIGGLGNIWGALFGGLFLGVVSGVASGVAPSWFDVVEFGLMMLVLAVRPQGLLGRRVGRRG